MFMCFPTYMKCVLTCLAPAIKQQQQQQHMKRFGDALGNRFGHVEIHIICLYHYNNVVDLVC